MPPLMNVETVVVLFAIATIFGLVGVVAIDSILMTQEAEAKGCRAGIGANASKGRCIHP
jgi:Flp pilus assembly protein CpaB